jgi:hypothetical protein
LRHGKVLALDASMVQAASKSDALLRLCDAQRGFLGLGTVNAEGQLRVLRLLSTATRQGRRID